MFIWKYHDSFPWKEKTEKICKIIVQFLLEVTLKIACHSVTIVA